MMESFVIDLLRTSLVVGAAACALAAAARPWYRRFSAGGRNRLWLLLAILLLAGPFLRPPQAYRIALPAAVSAPAEEAYRGQAAAPQSAGETGGETAESVPQTAAAPAPQAAAPEEGESSARLPSVTPETAAQWIWGAGAAAFVLWQAGGEFLFRRRVRRWARPVEEEAVLALYRSVLPEVPHPPLLRCAAVETPVLAGALRPRLLLPERTYEAETLGYLFRHELCHRKSRDIWRKLLYLTANAIHWFNPAAWLLRREAERDLERLCDERVVAAAGAAERRAYGAVLLDAAGSIRGPAASTYISNDARALRDRLESILRPGRRSGRVWTALAGLAVCGAVVLTGCFGGAEVPADTAESIGTDREIQHILILGTAQNTPQLSCDAVLLVTCDYDRPALDVLSIPRDTYFAQAEGTAKTPGRGAFSSDTPLETAAELVSQLTGTRVDATVIVGAEALAGLVDAVGGVTCAVPRDMDYDDPAQGLSIHLTEGTRHLDGEQFVGLLRYRLGNDLSESYPQGDLDRIQTQQQAIGALAEAVCGCSLEQITALTALAAESVTTDLSAQQLLYLSKGLLSGGLSAEDVTCSTLPGANGSIWSEEYQCQLSYWIPAGTEKISGMPDLSDPQSAAEMLLARAFDFAAAGVQPDIQVRDGFWNITYTDRDSYVVEIDRDLPYPKTLYAFVRVPPGGWEEPELPGPEEAAGQVRAFLKEVYGVDAAQAPAEVYRYDGKLSVAIQLSETEVFHVQIHTGTLAPCGILYFDRAETARQAMEAAGADLYKP